MFWWSAAALIFIFLMTTAGAGSVFLFKKSAPEKMKNIFLGAASGIMLAASFWGLLLPAAEKSEEMGIPGWITVMTGFSLGVLFLLLQDKFMPAVWEKTLKRDSPLFKRKAMMFSAVTIHNIPEGMSVGAAFAFAAASGFKPENFASAVALALGIGIQNIFEGAAVSLPLTEGGTKRGRAFLCSMLSGAVEPVFGMLAFLLSALLLPILPVLLSFSAGAMIYVVVAELLPSSISEENGPAGAVSVCTGFLLMMTLDTLL